MTTHEEAIYRVLKHYWGYEDFRSIQREVILSIMEGEDTLALMPTGGGKSLTYQVPTLACEGLCVVVTPLIALMKDQVDRLRSLHIRAVAIHCGMSAQDIDRELDNCIYGDTRFLYVSPERLETEIFRTRLQRMPVTLLAVDEAHCISQWGYDFRPSYLRIAELREYLPEGVPILALTASATPPVQRDIMERLHFTKPHLLQASFARPNLSYSVRHNTDNFSQTLRVLEHVPGSGIIYVRKRNHAEEVSLKLTQRGVSAAYYHAGMTPEARATTQQAWLEGTTRVIVATNAFGMGIDKPDVRFVIHYDPCDTLEAYYQEAGRAGRDGKRAYALLLINETDEYRMEKRIENSFPPRRKIKQLYDHLCSWLRIPIGEGGGTSHPFNIYGFCAQEHLFEETVIQIIKILQLNGYLAYEDATERHPQVVFTVPREELYSAPAIDAELEELIVMLLRCYTGIFHFLRPIDIEELSHLLECTEEHVKELLSRLWKLHIIKYIPPTQEPMIHLYQDRLPKRSLRIAPETHKERKEMAEKRLRALLSYAHYEGCRSQALATYFGATQPEPCGVCVNCLAERNRKIEGGDPYIRAEILRLLASGPVDLHELVHRIPRPPEHSLFVVDILRREGLIRDKAYCVELTPKA